MLILRRQIGESLILTCTQWPGEVRILVAERDAQTGRIKLGIEAPLDVHVVREELLVRPEECTISLTKEVKNHLGETLHLKELGVLWYGCCGYDCVYLETKTPERARALFLALQHVQDVETD